MANKDLIKNNEHLNKKQKALGLLLCIAQEVNSSMDKAVRPIKLSPLQVNILHILDYAPKEGLTVNQIKQSMVEDSPNISRALNKLMEKKLVLKRRDKQDQRIVHITITDKGRDLHHEADALLLKAMNVSLTDEDADRLYEVLSKF
ncbi:MAG: winged helix DNA-binding protein [Carboxylicivirga sp.]|jgi:DNA-binding MarR family transcriptional regulator|nr:winged helix DNA-binding protein [Carboxylicivirga sp.]